MQKINQLILWEYSHHPKAQLVDYYKLFFQANFGAEHFISDKISVEINLQKELEQLTFSGFPLLQNIGYKTPIYRVSLQLIVEKFVTFERFSKAFLNSSFSVELIQKNEWENEWEKIQNIIFEMKPSLKNIETDLQIIQTAIREFTSVHHSEIYKKHYNPHYRLLSEKELNNL